MSLSKLNQPIQIHPLGFAPDYATNTMPLIIVDMNGMYPTLSGVRMLPSLVVQSNALPSPALEAFLAISTSGGTNTFAGTGQHLYQLMTGGSTIVTPAMTYDQFANKYQQYQNLPHLQYGDPSFGPTYSFNSGPMWTEVDQGQTYHAEQWSFIQAGNDTIATNGADPVQVYSGTSFGPLGGGPPIAKFVTTVDPGAGTGFIVILANLSTDPTGWVSSGPGSDTVWTLNVNDLSASGFLRSESGPITGLKSLRTYAVAFKSNAVYLGQFIGPPFVWDWQPVSHQVGTLNNDGIVDLGDLLVFVGPDDFYQFDGTNVTSIPNGVKEWFFGTPGAAGTGIANPQYLDSIQGRYDSTSSVVYWHFSSVNAQPAGALDTFLSWNRRTGRWGVGHLYIQAVVQNSWTKSGMTYDQFTALYQQYQNIPHVTYDSALFQPGSPLAQALVLTDNKLYSYTGVPNSGYVQFGDVGLPGMLLQVNNLFAQFGVAPTLNAFINVFSRKVLGQPLTQRKTNIPLGARSDYNFRCTDFWQQFQFTFQTDAELQAIWLEARPAGNR